MKALTLGVLEIVAWVDHGELDLGSVGEVDRLIDQQPARLHAALSCARSVLQVHVCDDGLHPLCERCGRSGRLDAVRCPACRPRGVRAAHVVSVEDPTATLRLGNEAIAGATVAESAS